MLLLLLACAADSSGDPIADWEASTGQDLQDCGALALGHCADEVEALDRCPWLENGDCAAAERLD